MICDRVIRGHLQRNLTKICGPGSKTFWVSPAAFLVALDASVLVEWCLCCCDAVS